MAEEAHDRAKKRVAGGDDIQSRIKASMRSRVPYFKEQADSLTLEGVRRLLEKDMGLETRELDSHKRFIRLSLDECLAGGVDKNDSRVTAITAKKSAKEEAVESPDGFKGSKDKKEPFSEEKEKMEDSPVMGLLTGNKTENEKGVETEVTGNKEVPNESTIKIAIRERVSYVKANSEKVTMAGFRRLLEEDLKLEKNTLDPYKKLITEQLDQALSSYEDSEPPDGLKKKNIKNNSQRKVSKKGRSEESSDSLDSENNEEDEVKPKRKIATKAKVHNPEGAKKRKRPEREVKESEKKRVKSEDNSDAEESGASEDNLSQSPAEKPTKKKELSTPVYDKRVEHLKSVIKSCGMSIPPAVYKKVKQVPENKREAQLIKELEEILAREGLSSNPSEKEIKEVKKKKDRAKELEGIDMNNIVSSSRRRSTTTTFVAPPKPPPVVNDADESEDSDSNDDEDDDDSDDEGNDDEEENGVDDGDDEEVEDEEDDDSD